MTRGGAMLVIALGLAGCAADHRLAAFRATLAANQSATTALEQWCTAAHLASPATISAQTIHDEGDPVDRPTPAIRAALGVTADDPVRMRHVLLSCGGVVLSDARNWYVPARLTPAMNHALDTSHVPFGKVVAPGGLHREHLPAAMAAPAACSGHAIHHETAVLRRDDGRPIALVSECYTRANLGRKNHADARALQGD